MNPSSSDRKDLVNFLAAYWNQDASGDDDAIVAQIVTEVLPNLSSTSLGTLANSTARLSLPNQKKLSSEKRHGSISRTWTPRVRSTGSGQSSNDYSSSRHIDGYGAPET